VYDLLGQPHVGLQPGALDREMIVLATDLEFAAIGEKGARRGDGLQQAALAIVLDDVIAPFAEVGADGGTVTLDPEVVCLRRRGAAQQRERCDSSPALHRILQR
jgi:hypothetical protein